MLSKENLISYFSNSKNTTAGLGQLLPGGHHLGREAAGADAAVQATPLV